MSYHSKNPRFNSTILSDIDQTVIDNPQAGSHKLVNRAGTILVKDSTGAEVQLGSGGGSGFNYIEQGNADSSISDWSTYADAAQATPEDATGGTANSTLTRNETNPLRGAADFAFTKDAANRQGEGFSYPFALENVDKTKVLGISFEYDATDANYVDGDLSVYIYDVDSATLIVPSFGSEIKAGKGTIRTGFLAADATSTNYRLVVHIASTNAAGYVVKFDDFVVGAGNATNNFDGIWKSYDETVVTVTSSSGTATNISGNFVPYRTVGGSWRMKFNIAYDHTATSATWSTTLDGVTFASGFQGVGTTERSVGQQFDAYTSGTSVIIAVVHSGSTNINQPIFSGDVALASKPTWADFDPVATVYPTADDLALGTWQAFSETNVSNQTTNIQNQEGYYRRIGDTLEVSAGQEFSGAASGNYQPIIPNGYTIDRSKIMSVFGAGANDRVAIGVWAFSDAGAGNHAGTVVYDMGSDIIYLGRDGGNLVTATSPTTITDNDVITWKYSIPVEEFANVAQVPPVGIEVAANGSQGVLRNYETEEVSIVSGGFTGGTIRFVKINNLVTAQVVSSLTHASDSSPVSVSGFIPEKYRPTSSAENSRADSGGHITFLVSAAGAVRMTYRDYSGTLTARTSSGGHTLTYYVE